MTRLQVDVDGQSSVQAHEMSRLAPHWKAMVAVGVACVLLGLYSMVTPVASMAAVSYLIATVLVLSGCANLIQAIQLRNQLGSSGRFVYASVAIVGGVLAWRFPEAGFAGLAAILCFYFLVNATTQWIVLMNSRSFTGRGFFVAGSILSFFLGAFILASFPFSSLSVPGTLLGVELIVNGGGMVGFGGMLRKMFLGPKTGVGVVETPADEGAEVPSREDRVA